MKGYSTYKVTPLIRKVDQNSASDVDNPAHRHDCHAGACAAHVWQRAEDGTMLVRSTLVVSTFCIASLAAQEPAHPPVVGRWDLTVSGGEGRHLPSWLEVHWSGARVLVGRFVGVVGSVRPISRLDFANDTLRWSLPPQWEEGNGAFQFTGAFSSDTLAGSVITPDGDQLAWSAHRAPSLERRGPVEWGRAVKLLDRKSVG